MLTEGEAKELRRLMGAANAAEGDVTSYRTWRHPDADTAKTLDRRARAAHDALDKFITEITEG